MAVGLVVGLVVSLAGGLVAPAFAAAVTGAGALAGNGGGEGAASVTLPRLPDPVDPADTTVAPQTSAVGLLGGMGWGDPGAAWAPVTDAAAKAGGDGGRAAGATGPRVSEIVKLRGHRGIGADIGDPTSTLSGAPTPVAAGPVGVELRPKGINDQGQVWLRFGAWDTTDLGGTRWFDPSAPKANGIRIDEGVPHSPFPSQQVDHVIVRIGGRILGPDGKPIVGSLKQNPDAHIPLSDWLNWTSWNAP